MRLQSTAMEKPRCAQCGNSRSSRSNLLCRLCDARARRKGRPAATDLAQFLYARLLEDGITQGQLARRLGVNAASVTEWLQGATPTRASLRKLEACFGDSLPAITPDEDGRRREQGRELQRRFGALAHTPEVYRRSAQSRRGLKKGPSAAGAAAAVKRWREGRGPTTRDHLRVHLTEPVAYALHNLGCRLDHHPDPTTTQLRDWATDLAARYPSRYTSEAALAMWRPRLRERRLLSGGRPPLEKRHELVEGFIEAAPRDRSGRLPPGFWPEAARKVRVAEGETAIDGDDGRWLRRWLIDHKKRCAAAVTADVTARQAVSAGAARG
jgi:transcriptional regulator with XRE-family HTH domain